MKRILVVHRERDGFRHKHTSWKDYTFHFVDFCLHYMFRVKDSGEIEGILSREKMEHAVRVISANAYDAVLCESAEAFLLQFVLSKKGMEHPLFIISDLNRLRKARMLCRWIESVYGENPFENIMACPSNYWFCYTYSELSEHEALGIERKRLFYVPTSLYFQDETLIAEKGRAQIFTRIPNSESRNPLLESVCGKVVASGNNYRDYETLIRAADGLPSDVHIFSSDLYAKNPRNIPANVHVHDYVPLETLYGILSAAKFVIIPLQKNTYLSPGTGTAGQAIGFGKPVIASDLPCLYDYVVNGETGILVKPGDAVGLRNAIFNLYGNETKQQRMSKHAKKLSDKLDAVAEKNLEEMFFKATSGAPCSPCGGFENEFESTEKVLPL